LGAVVVVLVVHDLVDGHRVPVIPEQTVSWGGARRHGFGAARGGRDVSGWGDGLGLGGSDSLGGSRDWSGFGGARGGRRGRRPCGVAEKDERERSESAGT